ncbi:MAG TPA: PH domain-containing protein [Anaerolineae bacterium]|nr:PH domain-containing protein [Anaerolineae bacterium]
MGYVESLMGKNEQIIVIERQHWTTLLMSFLVNLFLVAVIVVLWAVLGNYVDPKNPGFLPVVRSILLFALLFPVGRFGWGFIQWEAEQYLVTSRRVMQTEGIVNKKTTDSSLEKVNDIILTQSFLGRILGYGDLEIITGSDIGINLLKRLANPVKFKTALLDAKASMHDPDILSPHELAPVPMAGGLLGDKPKGAATADDDPLKQIAELDNLRKSGAISDAEYQSAKARLLSKL